MPLRHQDPTTGRWNGIDPVTHFSSSTYASHNNNPVFWADPSGAWGDPVNGLSSSQGSPASGGGGGGILGTLLNIGVNLALNGLQNKLDRSDYLNIKGQYLFSLQTGKGKGSKIYIVKNYIKGNNKLVYADVNDVNVRLLTLNDNTPITKDLFFVMLKTIYTEMGTSATTSADEGARIYSTIENIGVEEGITHLTNSPFS